MTMKNSSKLEGLVTYCVLSPGMFFSIVLFYSTNVYLDYVTFTSQNNNQKRQPRTESRGGEGPEMQSGLKIGSSMTIDNSV